MMWDNLLVYRIQKKALISCPERTYDLLVFTRAESQYILKELYPGEGGLDQDDGKSENVGDKMRGDRRDH